ncbi:NAD/FAD-binding protein, partial [Chromobacterium piscinae]
HYLLPMAAAIWSSPCRDILAFPAETFLRFCLNHGLLQIRNRPPWRTVPGGARQYVDKIAAGLA